MADYLTENPKSYDEPGIKDLNTTLGRKINSYIWKKLLLKLGDRLLFSLPIDVYQVLERYPPNINGKIRQSSFTTMTNNQNFAIGTKSDTTRGKTIKILIVAGRLHQRF